MENTEPAASVEPVETHPSISHRAAQRVVAAALAEAERLGIAIHVAVMDRAANLIAYARMADAAPLAMQTALDKAYTAASFRFPTADWPQALAELPPLIQHNILQRPRLIIFPGGLPITYQGHPIGAIGVSGGSAEQDEQCAAAGVKGLQE